VSLPSLVLATALLVPQAMPANGESFALLSGLRSVQRIDLTLPVGPCEGAGKRLAAVLKTQLGLEVSFDPEDRDPEALRFVAGAATDPELAALVRPLGLEPIEGGFRLLGHDSLLAGDALVAVFQDPARGGRPLCLVLGNGLDELACYLDGVPRLTRPHLWVYDDGELALECPLTLGGRPRAEEVVDYRARRAAYFAQGGSQTFENLTVHARDALSREAWRDYARALVATQKRVFSWLGVQEPPTVELFVYDHLEDFEACLGAQELQVANRLRPRVHVLVAPGLPNDGGGGLARVLARELAGTPRVDWVEDGLAVAAADSWWGTPLSVWLARLSAARLLPASDELFAPDARERFSPHVLDPSRGLVFQELVRASQSDPRRLRALWKGADLEPRKVTIFYRQGLQALGRAQRPAGNAAGKKAPAAAGAAPGKTPNPGGKAAGKKGAGKAAKAGAAKAAAARAAAAKAAAARQGQEAPQAADDPQAPEDARPKAPGKGAKANLEEEAARAAVLAAAKRDSERRLLRTSSAPFRHGLALVEDEAASYGSRAVDPALEAALALDPAPDAVSLTVLASSRDPRAPFLAPARRPAYGTAGDLALANACAAAHARGLAVLLSLEVLAAPHGAWADVISWSEPDDQERFATSYERVALHYALLAELLQAELFSFGSNLRESVRTDPQEPVKDVERLEARRAAWNALLERLRAAFSGGLTLGARFPTESSEIGFLDQLDFVGLEVYPRFPRLDSPPSPEGLRRALRYDVQQTLDLAVRWNKPLLYVQAGFPSRAESWDRSWVPSGALDPGAQALYLETLADVLAGKLDNADSLRGFFLWNWPLDERRAGPDDGGFSLRGKPAEAALERLFAR